MAKLILTLDGAVIREYPLTGDSISIGRKAGNDVQLNDLTVSGRHALITTLGSNVYIDDLGSTNGTLLNGRKVNKSLLKHSDVIQIGTHQFTYFDERKGDYEPTMFIKAEVDNTKVISRSDPSGGVSTSRGTPLAAVKILSGPLANKILELRKPFNTLGFNGLKMAMIARTPAGYTISTLKSTRLRRASDTPLVNGKPIGFSQIKLNNNDVIEVGGTRIQFYYMH